MISRYADEVIQNIPGLQSYATRLSSTLHMGVMKGGRPMRKVADVLHGTWLGHPLHPVTTDMVIGAWGVGALFDVVALARNDRKLRSAGDMLARVGTWAAAPTIVTGLADFSTVKKPAASTTALHASLNGVSLALYLVSIRERKRRRHGRGVSYSLIGIGISAAAAWLGGHLVYNHKVGVDHGEASGPEVWTAAVPASGLPAGQPQRADVDGNPVILYRVNGSVHALDAVCNHAGAPLEEGSFDGCFVQCPWHDSVFDVRDGSVRSGPATRPQSAFDVRERDGMIEVRIRTS